MTAQFLLNFSRTFSTKTSRIDAPFKTSQRRKGTICSFFFLTKRLHVCFLFQEPLHISAASPVSPPAGLCIENNRESRLTGASTCPAPVISAVLAPPSLRFNLVVDVTHPSTAAAILRRGETDDGVPERSAWHSSHRHFCVRM